MKATWYWLLGAVAIAATAGLLAGTALAGGGANGIAPRAAAGANFPTGTAIKVKGAAVINGDGTVLRSSTLPFTLSSSTRLGTGLYQLIWNHNVTGCGWVATIGVGTFGGSVPGGEITTAGRAGNTNGVFVETFNSAGTLADLPFHLIVIC